MREKTANLSVETFSLLKARDELILEVDEVNFIVSTAVVHRDEHFDFINKTARAASLLLNQQLLQVIDGERALKISVH